MKRIKERFLSIAKNLRTVGKHAMKKSKSVVSVSGYPEALIQDVTGGKLVATNYFVHGMCRDGLCKGLYRDRMFHLLVPEVMADPGVASETGEECLRKMRAGQYVIADVGEDASTERVVVNLVFVDGTNSPFSMTIPRSRSVPFFRRSDDARRGLLFKAYAGPGIEPVLELEMKLRFVENPFLAWKWDPEIDEISDPILRRAARQGRDQGRNLVIFKF